MKDTIGSVNMRALDIYEQVEKEYHGLTEKRDTLFKEKEDVVHLMEEIEEKKQDLFIKNYENINENFKKIFGALSSKGEAYLELEDNENPLEAGVQIKVRLAGTKFMDIRSLSGGEKTMTALAFIFAIQEYDPASFYVLDEVDAALDKHNSEKFAKLIRKYAEKAQYVIISHNDAVISEADSLYGVSMNEHGVTNVVSLKV
jgi:chromosome segregation protein